MEIAEYASIGKDIVIAVAATITAFVAINGLNTWQRELKGKVRFEAARDLIRATFDLRDRLADARSPFISGHEFPENYDPNGTNDQVADGQSHVYIKRWEPVYEAWRIFRDRAVEVEVLLGDKATPYIDAMNSAVQACAVSVDALVANSRDGGRTFETDREFGVKVRSEVHASIKDEKNDINIRVKAAVEGITNKLKVELR